jgi:hypothetical protein
MSTQHILMYGLSRSPILAHFQNMPINLQDVSQGLEYRTPYSYVFQVASYPVLFRSRMVGNIWCT